MHLAQLNSLGSTTFYISNLDKPIEIMVIKFMYDMQLRKKYIKSSGRNSIEKSLNFLEKATVLKVRCALKSPKAYAWIQSGNKCDLRTPSVTEYYDENASDVWYGYQRS